MERDLGANALACVARKTAAYISSEHDADPQAARPDRPAALPGRAVEHLEALRKIDILLQLQAGAAGGIIDKNAINDRGFRP